MLKNFVQDSYRSEVIVNFGNAIKYIATAFQIGYLGGEGAKSKSGPQIMPRSSFIAWEPIRTSNGERNGNEQDYKFTS